MKLKKMKMKNYKEILVLLKTCYKNLSIKMNKEHKSKNKKVQREKTVLNKMKMIYQ